MLRHIRHPAALGLALFAMAAPAAAQTSPSGSVFDTPHVPIPAGQVQHTVTVTSYPAATNTVQRDGERNEMWTSETAGRALESNATTGAVKSDCEFAVGAVTRCWTASDTPGDPGIIHLDGVSPSLRSWADDGAIEKAQIDQPATHLQVTGKTTYLGRAALTVVQSPEQTSEGGTATFNEIVDAQTFLPLWSESVITGQPYTMPDGTKGTQQFDEIIAVKTIDILSPEGIQLTMDPHPGATVVDDLKNASQSAAARRRAAARKAAARRRAAARKAAARRRAAERRRAAHKRNAHHAKKAAAAR